MGGGDKGRAGGGGGTGGWCIRRLLVACGRLRFIFQSIPNAYSAGLHLLLGSLVRTGEFWYRLAHFVRVLAVCRASPLSTKAEEGGLIGQLSKNVLFLKSSFAYLTPDCTLFIVFVYSSLRVLSGFACVRIVRFFFLLLVFFSVVAFFNLPTILDEKRRYSTGS